jgi:hypothetical protein
MDFPLSMVDARSLGFSLLSKPERPCWIGEGIDGSTNRTKPLALQAAYPAPACWPAHQPMYDLSIRLQRWFVVSAQAHYPACATTL